MNKTRILLILAVLLTPLLVFAQDDEATPSSIVDQLSARCPSQQRDQWVINSVETDGDTVVVELMTPSSLTAFLSVLTSDNSKAKRLWIQQLSNFGDEWKRLVEYLAQEGLPMRLLLKPHGSHDVYSVFFASNEVGTILAND